MTVLSFDPRLSRLLRMRASLMTAARYHDSSFKGFRYRSVMITLTYSPSFTNAPYHISDFIRHLHDFFLWRKVPLRLVWVAELTKAGVLHYHVLVWYPYIMKDLIPKPDNAGWWPWGMSRIEFARSPLGYLVKYISKINQHGHYFPKSVRIHGVRGLNSVQRIKKAWWLLPVHIKDSYGSEHCFKPSSGGGYVSRLTGELIRSRWRFLRFSDFVYMTDDVYNESL